MKLSGFLLVCVSLFITPALAMVSDESDKENTYGGNTKKRPRTGKVLSSPSLSKKPKPEESDQASFDQALEGIKQTIESGHQEVVWQRIVRASRNFQDLNYSEKEWKKAAHASGAYKWPSQKTWKEVVGGHLFFPQQTIEWDGISVESYHLRRIDYIWAFAAGAKLNHAFSKFYLAKMLNKIRSEYTDLERPEFFHKLFQEAYGDFLQCIDCPEVGSDVCYVIGRHYTGQPYLSSNYVEDDHIINKQAKSWHEESWYKKDTKIKSDENEIVWHTKGADLRNQFEILNTRKWAKALYFPPTADEYLALARAGYLPAYSEAAHLTKGFEEKKKIRKEALKRGYKIALLGLGYLYENKSKIKKARRYYIKAGEAGILRGYIDLGLSYVGNIKNITAMEETPLKNRSQTEIDEAAKAFKTAGELGNPEGWEYLMKLYIQLYKKEKLMSFDEFSSQIADGMYEGIRFGSASCYAVAQSYCSEEGRHFILENYGQPPQHELRYVIENFMNN